MRKLFRNARIFTPVDRGAPLAGKAQGEVAHFPKGAIYAWDGIIKAIGEEEQTASLLGPDCVDIEEDCQGRCLIPGFVDAHTHMCFAKRREEEFNLRLAGMEYLEILRRGGGILSSVRAVREASEEELFAVTRKHVLSALTYGATTVEIKSGYGLDTETELKMLRVIRRIGMETALDVVPTFMGAHAVPEEYFGNPDGYVEAVVRDMIPAVARQGIARFCDVFCEKNVFTLEQSRRVLEAARKAGLGLKIHADEVNDLGGAGLAAGLGATSAEHLLHTNDANIEAMARAGVIGILLPATAYSMRKEYAPARKMIDSGVPIAIATDCNPGTSYTESMPFVTSLAVLNMRLTVFEALAAATLNAAYAVGMSKMTGSLDIGKYADFLLLDGDSPAILTYHAGVNPVARVYKRGEPVWNG
jgi:imidazolonepropionase